MVGTLTKILKEPSRPAEENSKEEYVEEVQTNHPKKQVYDTPEYFYDPSSSSNYIQHSSHTVHWKAATGRANNVVYGLA